MSQETDHEIYSKPCSTCAEPIRISAKKCVNCESYQDWRRHFSVSTIVISLLVALIAVIGPTVSAIKTAFQNPKAEPKITLSSTEPRVLSLLISNGGDAAASLSKGRIELPHGHIAWLARPGMSDSMLIGPATLQVVNFVTFSELTVPIDSNQECKIVFATVTPDGPTVDTEADVNCTELRALWP